MEVTAKKSTFRTVELAYIALGAALISVCAWITVPLTVPFTMQLFAVFFVLTALGGRNGTIAIAVYLLLGAVGCPVFAGFTGGFGALIGMTVFHESRGAMKLAGIVCILAAIILLNLPEKSPAEK